MDERIGRWLAAWVDAVRSRPWRTLVLVAIDLRGRLPRRATSA
jgi:hypothetical protein